MEQPEHVLGVIALVCVVSSIPFLVFPGLSQWYVRSTGKGIVWAKALGEERTIRLIRFVISPIMLLVGIGAGVWAAMVWP